METVITIAERMKKEPVYKCPKCKVNMNKLTNGKYIIDGCPKCKGVWLDSGEVVNITRQGFFSYMKSYWRS